jgi:hypothetical protein
MKKTLFTILSMLAAYTLPAQIQFNPQIGFSFLKLSDTDAKVKNTTTTVDADFSADIGFMAGFDMRIGNRFNYQPGIFFARNVTVTKLKGDTVFTGEELEGKLIRSSVKLKSMVGYNLVHKDGFKLRLNAGPTYDFIVSVDNDDDDIDFEENDFKGGSFNFDASIGVDIWFLTGELGYSYGLTEAFDSGSDIQLEFDSKYNTVYFTLGMVFGKGIKK